MSRIVDNISPFLLLGVISGYIAVFKDTLQSLSWLQSLQTLMKVDIQWEVISLDLFSEHAAPTTLSIIIIALTFLAICHRMYFGEVREFNSLLGKKVILPLENFGALLAISLLGVILGLSFAALTTKHFSDSLAFLLASSFPLSAYYLIKWTLQLCKNNELSFKWLEDKKTHERKSRIQGFLILILMFTIMIGHYYIFKAMEYLKSFVLSFL